MSTEPDETVLLDPTLALRDLRSLSARIRRAEMVAATRNMESLIDTFEDLDAWITEGGYLPDQWRNRRRGRPRRVGDGPVVLEGVPHGKRSTYNKGCRCAPCTKANREAGAAYRQQNGD